MSIHRMPIRVPLLSGQKDRLALDLMLEQMTVSLVAVTRKRVSKDADRLITMGYRLDELMIYEFGPEIYVKPKLGSEQSAFRLWLRRVLIAVHLRRKTPRDYARIACQFYDLRQLIDGLNIFGGGLAKS